MIGSILDVQSAANGTSMDVWLVGGAEGAVKVNVPWCPSIHVHASQHRLNHLCAWLEQPEIRDRFGVGLMRMYRSRLSLDASEVDEVLEIDVHNSWNMRKLAAHIESRGDYRHYTLYSVDAHLAQRFQIEFGIAPFRTVEWNGSSFDTASSTTVPTLVILHMAVHYQTQTGFHTEQAEIESVEFRRCSHDGMHEAEASPIATLNRTPGEELSLIHI